MGMAGIESECKRVSVQAFRRASVQVCRRSNLQMSKRPISEAQCQIINACSCHAVKLSELVNDMARVKECQSFALAKGFMDFGVVKIFGIHRQKHCQHHFTPLQELKQCFHDQAVNFLKGRQVGSPTKIGFRPNLRCQRDNNAGLSENSQRFQCLLFASLQFRFNDIQPFLDILNQFFFIPALRAISLSQNLNCCKEVNCRSMRLRMAPLASARATSGMIMSTPNC